MRPSFAEATEGVLRFRPGQAMIETVVAVLLISFMFFGLFRLSHMLTGKILLEHAGMRGGRARRVGLNEFMCRKAASVAVIPVAGERLWPTGGDAIDWPMELARVPDYLYSEDDAHARAILDYEGWGRLSVHPGDGRDSRVALGFSLFDGSFEYGLEGRAGIEANASLYMTDQGR